MSDIQLVQSNNKNIATQNVSKAFVYISNCNLPLMATKRPVVVEDNTPGKPACKRTVAGALRRSLFHTEPEKGSCKGNDWTQKEESALVQYLCLFWEDAYNRWPTDGQQPKTWIFGIHVRKQ